MRPRRGGTLSGRPAMRCAAGADDALADRLGEAIAAGALSLEYQPKIDLESGAIAGVEALARWHEDELGPVSPATFVAVAERHDLVDRLTDWLLREALAQWSAWEREGHQVGLALNLSAISLRDPGLPDRLERMCATEGVPPMFLTIEITESATQELVPLLDTLTRIRLKGMGLALDDFGTGYSSLLQLRQLPYSELKIDQAFVREATISRESRLIIKALIDLAHGMGLSATAEGVEDFETLSLLREWGCDRAQGYLMSRPLRGPDLPSWIARSCARWRPPCLGQPDRLGALGPLTAG
ncbi:EAL domain-containing protein [Sphingomonas parva]|uniref:EAL domain-containing protein n=1 Tax=Sphingomonas parva TaxID=2555898 RepID=A0A4Y8ZQ53_9SPHN|nr:EAL domain-containing protein [Sphingomonas parva]TFI58094.1 EAL domain-containing protein [Sphingomonas parva]